jgi:alanine-glyoxylate transaminase / serine-glyoxylate transaminase / serine-pyruvate transaminase
MLMIPGPSEPEPEALATLSMPIMPHYGTKWGEFYYATLAKLQKIFKTKNDVMLVPGPGQLAVEMAAENIARKGEEAYVCSNGYFGEMMEEIVGSHGVKPILVKSELGKAITLDQVKQALERKDVEGKSIFLVHNDTSTGVLNPAGEILRYCKQQKGMFTIVDCISSFGGTDIQVDEWKIDFCVGYASKALGGIFGIVPVSVSEDSWSAAKKNRDKISGRFLNLNEWAFYAKEWRRIGHPYPCSMPTSIIAALNTSVDIALKEGLVARYERHRRVAALTREGLESLGLEIFPDKKYASNTVSVARVDAKRDKLIRDTLDRKYDIMIGGGIGKLEGKIIRIGHMGTSASVAKVSIVLDAIKSILEDSEKRKSEIESLANRDLNKPYQNRIGV